MSQFATRIAVLTARIAKDTEELAKLQAKAEAGITVEKLVAGTKVVANYGRGDTKKEIEATVLGTSVPVKGGAQVKITFGQGYDADIVTVSIGAVLRIIPAEGAALVDADPVANAE